MEIYIMDNGRMMLNTVEEDWYWRLDKATKDNLPMAKSMEMVSISGQQVIHIMEISVKTSVKDWEFTSGVKVDFTKVNGVEIV
jgi:hypothetical protein